MAPSSHSTVSGGQVVFKTMNFLLTWIPFLLVVIPLLFCTDPISMYLRIAKVIVKVWVIFVVGIVVAISVWARTWKAA